jgi:hypothetical protein
MPCRAACLALLLPLLTGCSAVADMRGSRVSTLETLRWNDQVVFTVNGREFPVDRDTPLTLRLRDGSTTILPAREIGFRGTRLRLGRRTGARVIDVAEVDRLEVERTRAGGVIGPLVAGGVLGTLVGTIGLMALFEGR